MNQASLGTYLAASIALLLGGALYFVMNLLKQTKLGMAEQAAQQATTETKLSDSIQQVKDARKRAEEAATELAEIRKDMGGHKKKKFELQEEIKDLKRQLVDLREDMEQQLAARPAFAAIEDDAPEEKPTEPVIHMVKPEPVIETPVVHVPSENALLAELRTECSRLTDENTKLLHDNTEFKAIIKRQKDELSRIQRKARDFSRIEIMTKNKSALLEDKLKSLQRQHYNTISELAALRGDVHLPRSMIEKNIQLAKPDSSNS